MTLAAEGRNVLRSRRKTAAEFNTLFLPVRCGLHRRENNHT